MLSIPASVGTNNGHDYKRNKCSCSHDSTHLKLIHERQEAKLFDAVQRLKNRPWLNGYGLEATPTTKFGRNAVVFEEVVPLVVFPAFYAPPSCLEHPDQRIRGRVPPALAGPAIYHARSTENVYVRGAGPEAG